MGGKGNWGIIVSFPPFHTGCEAQLSSRSRVRGSGAARLFSVTERRMKGDFEAMGRGMGVAVESCTLERKQWKGTAKDTSKFWPSIRRMSGSECTDNILGIYYSLLQIE